MRYLTALLSKKSRALRSIVGLRHKHLRRRLFLEQLEDRRVLATISWDGGGGDSNWHTPANWSTDTLPGAADDVQISSGIVAVTDSDVTVSSLAINSAVVDFHGNSFSTTTLSILGGGGFGRTPSVLATAGNVTVSGTFDWTGGTLRGPGTVTVLGSATLHVQAENFLGNIFRSVLDGVTLVNAGLTVSHSISVNGQLVARNGAVINNTGVFDAQPESTLIHDGVGAVPTFNNSGLVQKSTGTQGSSISIPFHNSGTVEVQQGTLAFSNYIQTGGKALLNGGDLSSTSGLNIEGGSLEGAGTVFGNVFNAGATSPGLSPGIIEIHGNFRQAANGFLQVEIGGLTVGDEYDQVDVHGTVALAGTFNVSLINGFVPTLNQTFVIVSNDGTDAVSGTFTGVPEFGIVTGIDGSQFEVRYVGGDGNDVTIKYINRPPVANAGGPYTVAEGSSLLLNGSGSSDPDPLDTLTYSWDVNGDGVFGDAIGVSPTLTWAQLQAIGINDGPRTVPNVRVRVDDAHAHVVDSPVTMLTVTNVAPTVGVITAPVDPTAVTTAINASASFTDPGTRDTHTASWNWGDNSLSAGIVTETNGSGSVSGSHTYSAAGVYTVTLTVTDDDSGVGTSTFQYIVVYDPSAGFVTGGGWINSPLGAYAANPTLTGKANFGFESKYLKGNNVPTGNTEFQFKLANFNFKSTSYEWLVVSGAKARYRGVGTVNGAGNYGFELTAWDGQVNGGGGVDRFRIKIWNNNQGNGVVYDNMMGAADGANPITALGGGSIVIHTSAQPLLASGGTALATGTEFLTQEILNQAVDQAINYWRSTGIETDAVSNLQQIHVQVADLSGDELGIASDTNYVWIDRDAAGYGWQLNSLGGTDPSVNGGMDLLSVVAHELGHKLGFEHSYEVNDLMAPRLDVSSVRTMVGSLSQPLALFSTSLVVLGSVPLAGTNPSVVGTLRFPKKDFEENQARDQLFASLDDSPAKPLVRSPNIARKFQSDATKKPASEAEDLLAEDLMDTIALAQLATNRQNN